MMFEDTPTAIVINFRVFGGDEGERPLPAAAAAVAYDGDCGAFSANNPDACFLFQ